MNLSFGHFHSHLVTRTTPLPQIFYATLPIIIIIADFCYLQFIAKPIATTANITIYFFLLIPFHIKCFTASISFIAIFVMARSFLASLFPLLVFQLPNRYLFLCHLNLSILDFSMFTKVFYLKVYSTGYLARQYHSSAVLVYQLFQL